MRILTLSDLHIGKQKWDSWGVSKAKEAIKINQIDVLYFGGDLAEPHNEFFESGLEILANSPAKIKLFTLGNNDLEQLKESTLTNHYEEMKKRIGSYGFHLLDDSPYIIGNLAFVGNIGWYDGSLWKRFKGKTDFPNSRKEISKAAQKYFQDKEFKGKIPDQMTYQMFYTHCQNKLKTHLNALETNERIKKIILGLHFVPARYFIESACSRFAYLSWYMGAKNHLNHYKRNKVILGFTGHTHKSDKYVINNTPIYNLSGTNQPIIFDLMQ